jgi:hypothetical protein
LDRRPRLGAQIDKRRIATVFGKLAEGEIAAIDEGLILFLGLG